METNIISILQTLEQMKKWIFKLEERIAVLEGEVAKLNVK